MADNDNDPQPTPVAPAPIETAPSATGVVDGDEDDVREAPPAPDSGEKPSGG